MTGSKREKAGRDGEGQARRRRGDGAVVDKTRTRSVVSRGCVAREPVVISDTLSISLCSGRCSTVNQIYCLCLSTRVQ